MAAHANRLIVASIWIIAETQTRPTASGEDAPQQQDHEVERANRSINEAVARGDATAHADLAITYLEMGLHADALREAATALAMTGKASVTQAALWVLFGARLLKPGGLERMKRRLGGHSPRGKLGPHHATWSKLYEALAKLAEGCGAAFAFVIDGRGARGDPAGGGASV
jgi:hypothetical protein